MLTSILTFNDRSFTVLKKHFEKEKRGNEEVVDTGYIACSTI